MVLVHCTRAAGGQVARCVAMPPSPRMRARPTALGTRCATAHRACTAAAPRVRTRVPLLDADLLWPRACRQRGGHASRVALPCTPGAAASAAPLPLHCRTAALGLPWPPPTCLRRHHLLQVPNRVVLVALDADLRAASRGARQLGGCGKAACGRGAAAQQPSLTSSRMARSAPAAAPQPGGPSSRRPPRHAPSCPGGRSAPPQSWLLPAWGCPPLPPLPEGLTAACGAEGRGWRQRRRQRRRGGGGGAAVHTAATAAPSSHACSTSPARSGLPATRTRGRWASGRRGLRGGGPLRCLGVCWIGCSGAEAGISLLPYIACCAWHGAHEMPLSAAGTAPYSRSSPTNAAQPPAAAMGSDGKGSRSPSKRSSAQEALSTPEALRREADSSRRERAGEEPEGQRWAAPPAAGAAGSLSRIQRPAHRRAVWVLPAWAASAATNQSGCIGAATCLAPRLA